jgi:penicillin-insensitive murein DD-endopeptidase
MLRAVHDANPPITREELQSFARRYNLQLPKAYEEFLLRNNGGRPEPEMFPIEGLENNPFGGIQAFFGLNASIVTEDLEKILTRNQYGHETTLNVIRDVGAKWAQTHPENPFGVGDISLEHGGTMKGHPRGHKTGLEVDIRLMRSDGKLAGTDWRNAEYSQALTQDLVDAFKSHPNVARIYFNDPKVTGTQYLSNHDNHLHVVIKP